MTRKFFILFFLGFFGIAGAQQPSGSLTLKEAEQRFLKCNLSLLAERYNIDMAQARLLQARLFDNPVISFEQNVYNRLNGTYFDFGKSGESVVEIEQVIRLAGQRNKQIRLEKINREIAGYQFEEVMRTLRQELGEAFIEVYYLSKSLSVYDKEVSSLKHLLAGIKEQHVKGNVSLMEMTRLESMLFSLKKDMSECESHYLSRRGELNLLLNLPIDFRTEPIVDEGSLERLTINGLSYAGLQEMVSVRPDQKMARSNIIASQADLKLQKSLAFPEFSVKGNYDRQGNFINNYFAIGFSMSVPIFNRNQGNIKMARFNLLKAGWEQEYIRSKAETELYAAYTALDKAFKLYRSVDGRLEHNFEKLIAGANENFIKRNISLLEFIDFYDSYKETCIQLYDIKKNVFLGIENLNAVVGQHVFNN
ncbi:TolC family protein [Bacteroides hominis]|uniref:TolC family protein n=1 Tax=Bacteroides hominis TaxID=2763023 RepID=UPI0039C48424